MFRSLNRRAVMLSSWRRFNFVEVKALEEGNISRVGTGVCNQEEISSWSCLSAGARNGKESKSDEVPCFISEKPYGVN